MDYTQQIEEILDKIYDLPNSDAKVALLEEAIRIADSQSDIEQAFWLRKDLIDAATFSGNKLKALIHFTWCVTQVDKYAEVEKYNFTEEDILWEYKWVLDNVAAYPTISKQKIYELLEDMKRRYTKNGYNLRPYYKLYCNISMEMGEKEKAIHYYELMQKEKPDFNSDCKACDKNFEVDYYIFLKEYEKAISTAKPILDGKMKCAEIPHFTYSYLLFPLHTLGKHEEAMEIQQKGYRLISQSKEFVLALSRHIFFLSLVDVKKSLTIFKKHFLWGYETLQISNKFFYYLSSLVMLKKLSQENTKTITMQFPEIFSLYNENGKYEVATLINWFEQEVQTLAQAFDERNETEYYKKTIQEYLQYV